MRSRTARFDDWRRTVKNTGWHTHRVTACSPFFRTGRKPESPHKGQGKRKREGAGFLLSNPAGLGYDFLVEWFIF
jgi:hypothetical protein